MAVPGPEAVADLARMPEEVTHGASHLGVIAHRAAYLEGRAWLDALLAGLDENRRLLAALLAEHLPGVRYRVPEATFLAWLDLTASGSVPTRLPCSASGPGGPAPRARASGRRRRARPAQLRDVAGHPA